MKHLRNHARRIAQPRRGYTLLELEVALVVLGISLSGLFPLMAILSRDLQPAPTNSATCPYDCSTPARDGNTNGNVNGQPRAYGRHVWYLTPFHDTATSSNDAWVRKLGCSAQINKNTTDPCPATLSISPAPPNIDLSSLPLSLPMQSAVLFLDDYEGSLGSDDGSGTFTAEGWTLVSDPLGYHSDYHQHTVPTDSPSADFAQWTLTVTADGWYSIQATWPTDTELTLTNAMYQVTVPGQSNVSANVAQNNPGNGIADANSTNGTTWWPLTAPALLYLHQGDQVVVQLNVPQATTPGLSVIADAVRMVQNEVKIKSIERSLDGTHCNSSGADVTIHVSATVNLPQ